MIIIMENKWIQDKEENILGEIDWMYKKSLTKLGLDKEVPFDSKQFEGQNAIDIYFESPTIWGFNDDLLAAFDMQETWVEKTLSQNLSKPEAIPWWSELTSEDNSTLRGWPPNIYPDEKQQESRTA